MILLPPADLAAVPAYQGGSVRAVQRVVVVTDDGRWHALPDSAPLRWSTPVAGAVVASDGTLAVPAGADERLAREGYAVEVRLSLIHI